MANLDFDTFRRLARIDGTRRAGPRCGRAAPRADGDRSRWGGLVTASGANWKVEISEPNFRSAPNNGPSAVDSFLPELPRSRPPSAIEFVEFDPSLREKPASQPTEVLPNMLPLITRPSGLPPLHRLPHARNNLLQYRRRRREIQPCEPRVFRTKCFANTATRPSSNANDWLRLNRSTSTF